MAVSNPDAYQRAFRLVFGERAYSRGDLTWIYAIQAGRGGPIKIGRSNDPEARLRELQCGNHEELILLASWIGLPDEEAALHAEFAWTHRRGEWFDYQQELASGLKGMGNHFPGWAEARNLS